jgi:FkbM family methyltransferase
MIILQTKYALRVVTLSRIWSIVVDDENELRPSDIAMNRSRFVTHIPLALACPPLMESAVRYVLEGEYESHLDGSKLDILDIGANIGSFARWAELRWPGSHIRCYEPNPGTFSFLERNIAGRPQITAVNAAVYPGTSGTEKFFARYDGDGEAGLVSYAADTFRASAMDRTFDVEVVSPETLASADIVKLDVEGAEAAILRHLDLSRTQLVLAEFQNHRNRSEMRAILNNDFVPLLDEACPWDPILDYQDYRADLKGDVYGRMFYARAHLTTLTRRLEAA